TIDVEAALEVGPGLAVSDVVLTIGHRQLASYRDAAIVTSPGPPAAQFTAGLPVHRRISFTDASYYQIRHGSFSGFAPALHSRPRDPGRLAAIDVAVHAPRVLQRAVARYTFPGVQGGARLVAAERKMLTDGGFYDRTADYSTFVEEAAAD